MVPLRSRSVLVAAGLLLGLVGCERPEPEPTRALNVILVSIDTLRADHLGCYGYSRDTSPTIDAIARTGVRFDAAFSQRGLTFPSIASILTSKYPYTHGVVGMFEAVLSEEHETLAAVMKENGHRTVAFNAHLAFTEKTGFHRGFDEFRLFHSDDEPGMFAAIAEWLEVEGDRPFFLWVHSFGPHSPYQPPGPWLTRFTDPDYTGPYDGAQKPLYEVSRKGELSEADRDQIVALYDGKIAWVDHLLAGLVEALDTLGLRERTLLVVTSDHGEELFDHFLYFSHEASVYDSVLRIPLILSLPGVLPAGKAEDAVVQSIDLMPTVLDLLGLEPREGAQGRSLLPVLAGRDDGRRAYGSIDHDKEPLSILTVRSPRWRYVYNPDRYVPGWNLRFAEEELYDLRSDPGQQRNVVDEHPAVAAELRDDVRRWAAGAAAQRAPTVSDPDLEARLEALGYVRDAPTGGSAE